MNYSLDQLNGLHAAAFIAALGGIYEHSPWVAQQVAVKRPFASFEELLAAMRNEVATAPESQRLALICAHPELQGKMADTELTADSKQEQKSAGLDQCSPQEIEQLSALNRAYRERFGFPFVIAVRGLTRQNIIDNMTQRLAHERAVEFAACLEQIDKIAQLRLLALIN